MTTSLERRTNDALVAGLLLTYAALFVACFLRLGPQTLAWSLDRALGVVAYLALSLGVTFRALLGGRVAPAWLSRAQQGGWHGLLSTTALVLGVLHGLTLVVDRQSPQSLVNLLIPGASTLAPLAVGLGTLGVYGLTLVWATTKWRAKFSARTWRLLHLASYPTFAAVTARGLLAGTDDLRWLYAFAVGLAVWTFGLRFVEEREKRR
ncbi:ferric reductase-like transmembrane domain-containing protein [Deinococcus yavapaiensis]|uniref:Ferric reductase like protein n=1 Tax=Deinococcus yavapaiensis KR-236 TaxID=694435 RepID=A0A318S776_9DEIO|nr:ferric reductase-like transmembrane domain-containing protein [Deinococcus yavapaiensis]PYE54614.1 ferric reductase like protein [Deinococcus yavapaiensis KR-236]